ncbi:carbohydrate kinase family protein [Candidatus Falkowbacteria bacterium CG11_big_fil_rev_8_21_14_0_20_39_10]|uniref:Carbohydrate kinase family protein n=1 Tax=Candidatus Falkowbacteria bacterium CG11_big_fil_rev_8_21_14_0_20_39_10 TaxID=1974570 RepID=A0A2M6K8P5_9BACT|nr:MAG: carbohydrate kinase family protein [Candidatus Falkowbacteria bacterium CG11_big_fil_rev_8_21_14_0_20_39_10]
MNNSKNYNKILISGSLVYDRIMDFPGYFQDHILPDKIHILNVSFLVNGLKESYGGTAGNIAYNLSLLGERAVVLSTVGHDFSPYEKWLAKKVDLRQIKKIKKQPTASAYIITDKADNQITGFNPGAMAIRRGIFSKKFLKDSLAIISPGNLGDMEEYAKLYKRTGVRYIFDPGQTITGLSKNVLRMAIDGAFCLIGNDYEISLIENKTGWKGKVLADKVEMLIITKGAKGSEIYNQGKKYKIPPAKPKQVSDPTGAGDAYRAGLIKGLIKNWPLPKAGRLAGLTAVYAVENYGTQKHSFTWKNLKQRYKKNYQDILA